MTKVTVNSCKLRSNVEYTLRVKNALWGKF